MLNFFLDEPETEEPDGLEPPLILTVEGSFLY
jgi:hypothetical protein